jgi:hypothetical protein
VLVFMEAGLISSEKVALMLAPAKTPLAPAAGTVLVTRGRVVEEELARIEGRAARLDRLERDSEALLNHYARIVPEHLDSLEPAERNHVYKLLKLTVLAHQNGSLELSWALGADLCRDNEPLLRWSSANTTKAFRFRAVLTGDGSEEVVSVGA